MAEGEQGTVWNEAISDSFIEFGRYFVPEREAQIATVCGAIPRPAGTVHMVDLCCGEGLLSGALLEHFPEATVHAYDGSPAMLARTRQKLAAHGDRFDTRQFDIVDHDWRRFPWPLHAVVSSLAVHHLDGAGKQRFFADIAKALAPGGVLVIADLIEPTRREGIEVAAKAWDDAVRRRSMEIDGHLKAFEHFQSDNWNHYSDPEPDPIDQPSALYDQLKWLDNAGLNNCDVHWMMAGHAIYSGQKPGT